MDEDDLSNSLGAKSPIKRLGSTRKLMLFNNIRLQLTEQLRCLDTRMETQVAIVAELQDFFRRRAEVELDYSRSLDKLVKSLQLRHKEHKQKREQWNLFSSYSCWQHLVEQTRTLSKDHAALSEIYSAHLVNKLSQVTEDIQRIYKKCKEIGCDIHDEIFRVLHELHTALKTYQSYQANCKQAETKLRLAEAQRQKIELSIPKEKLDRSKKYRMIEKDVQKKMDLPPSSSKDTTFSTVASGESESSSQQSRQKRKKSFEDTRPLKYDEIWDIIRGDTPSDFEGLQSSSDEWQPDDVDSEGEGAAIPEDIAGADIPEDITGATSGADIPEDIASPHEEERKNKYFDAKLKALKARNEYILCIEASNATLHKYYVDDLSDLIDCMDLGFHHCISRALLMHVTSEEGRQKSIQNNIDVLNSAISGLDSRLDKQRFLEYNHSSFMIPKKLEFQGKKEDDEPEFQKLLYADMGIRLSQMETRINTVRAQNDEIWKTLETAEGSLLQILTLKDYDYSHYFGDNALPSPKPPETASLKLRADRHEIEEFYLTKLRDFLLGTSRIARLEVKYDYMRNSLAELSSSRSFQYTPNSGVKPQRRKCIGRLNITTQPKLFGGSLGEYIDSTNQDIPLIIRSCVRIINLYGLHHQGIFRVSGSQVEINNFRDAFEKGEDPLADITDASDMNSVAGVLKLYLRELREPLFPIIYFEQFMELAQLESKHDFVVKMKDLVQSLPRSVVIVMRYLFAFLNHLSEFSDENMMDPYNLAICFGPTLVPVPEEKDQVQYQNQVNELIKNIIIFHDDIFPSDIGGTQYEKYISKDEDNDIGDSPSENLHEDLDSEVYPSEDEGECVEATAQYDFVARNDRELSLTKGDNITLFSQVSCDWWRGAVSGKEGLVPDKYISIKLRDEGADKSNKWEIEGDTEEKKCESQFRESPVTDNARSKPVSSSVNSSWLPQQQMSAPNLTKSDSLPKNDNSEETGAASRSNSVSAETSTMSDSSEILNSGQKVTAPVETVNQISVSEVTSDSRDVKLIHTPDLVMDLPTQPDENSLILESPDMTSAERFAKPNQCTLKKNTKPAKPITDIKANVSPKSPLKIKPEIGIKPEISIKPVCLLHLNKEAKQ